MGARAKSFFELEEALLYIYGEERSDERFAGRFGPRGQRSPAPRRRRRKGKPKLKWNILRAYTI